MSVRGKSTQALYHEGFEEKLRCEKFFKHIAIGGRESIEKIKKMIESDPKNNMFEVDSVRHILNWYNFQN